MLPKIIESLGGTCRVAHLCGISPSAVSQMKAKGIQLRGGALSFILTLDWLMKNHPEVFSEVVLTIPEKRRAFKYISAEQEEEPS